MKLPDTLALSSEKVARLFPFHLLISCQEGCRILSAGSVLCRSLPEDYQEHGLNEYFKIIRPEPEGVTLTPEFLDKHAKTSFFLQMRKKDLSLRGQFIENQPGVYLFVGSTLVDSADSLKSSGILLSDFSPFDTTPDILILHRFREMQLNDQKNQTKKIREVIEARDQFNSVANTDSLTNIANRRGFRQTALQWIESKDDDESLFVVLVDLDGFKKINDSFGHEMGDQLLQTVAQKLVEETASDGIAGRHGGDEFVILLKLPNEKTARRRVEEIINAVKRDQHNTVGKNLLGLSVGVAEILTDKTLEQAIHDADIAMYEGRTKLRGIISWYTQALHERLEQRESLLEDLNQAVQKRQIVPVYQPLLHLAENRLSGFEVLARWHHPRFGPIPPVQFIQLAEDADLLPALDNLILQSALDQLVIWKKQGKQYSLHVNVSAPSVQPELPERILQELKSRNLKPEDLIVELTETTLIENTTATGQVLKDLSEAGIQIQLDDFGTGYSSLTHLQSFPVSGIKIDRSFVAAASDSHRSEQLLVAIIDIAKRLGLSTVAEGIETLEQLHLLEEAKCQYGQGYFFGRPANPDECEELNIDIQQAA